MKFKPNGASVRIVIFIFALFIVITVLMTNYFEEISHIDELSSKYAYEVYFTYVANRQTYNLYFMCNPDYVLADIIENIFTVEYFDLLQTNIDTLDTPTAQTIAYLMIATDEIPYGWEENELNISCNFDISIFHRNTICRIYIPYGASDIESCTIEYQ